VQLRAQRIVRIAEQPRERAAGQRVQDGFHGCIEQRREPSALRRFGAQPPLRGGALRCSHRRLAPRNSLRALRALRSDRRGEYEDDARFARAPAMLRFSAAHRRAAGPTARAFARCGVVCVVKAPDCDARGTAGAPTFTASP